MRVQEIYQETRQKTGVVSRSQRSRIFFAVFALVVCSLAGMISAGAQEPAQTPAPATELQVPAIAPHFRPEQKPLPELGRVGVDVDQQKPLSLREALALALENNKDIEVARHNVKI